MNIGFVKLQIEGCEFQPDSLSCWHDNGDNAVPVLFAVVAGEIGRLNNTTARWRHIGAHIPARFASSAYEIRRRVDSRDK